MPRRPGPWFNGWLCHSAFFSWLFLGVATWALNPFFSPRTVGDAVRAVADPNTPIGVVDTVRGTLNYYAGRQFTELDAGQADDWRRAHPDGLLILKSRDVDGVFESGKIPGDCNISSVMPLNFEDFHLVGDCRS